MNGIGDEAVIMSCEGCGKPLQLKDEHMCPDRIPGGRTYYIYCGECAQKWADKMGIPNPFQD